ncbi:unnamed protein product [Citrullus colocynthis]|uniref:Uncharacterized protein n=1 Tax=Citrullus colocynthis TaxID=252529 RepID=A0ABP0XTQ4_9ROSI
MAEEGSSKNSTTKDSQSYLKRVKETFQNDREKYEHFLRVFQDFRAQRIDTAEIFATGRRENFDCNILISQQPMLCDGTP